MTSRGRCRTLVVVFVVVLLTCGAAIAGAAEATVEVHGALRAMFHQGEIGEKVKLDALLPDADLYAVGALAELAGEITVIDGRAYLSYPEGEKQARTESSSESDAGATLLVATRVAEWSRQPVDAAIPFEKIGDEIGRLAQQAGLSLDGRIPFLLEGEFEELRWHVVDGKRLAGGGDSHEDHLAAAANLSRERTAATLIGFYSKKDGGVFTHMGSTTHIHCVVNDPLSAGHVDHVVIPVGATIGFPASPE